MILVSSCKFLQGHCLTFTREGEGVEIGNLAYPFGNNRRHYLSKVDTKNMRHQQTLTTCTEILSVENSMFQFLRSQIH